MDDADQGFVGGAVNTSRQIGAAVGAALLPAVVEAVNRGGATGDVAGDRIAMLVAAVVAGLAMLTAFRPAGHEATATRLHSHQLEL
jgi:hypothetical protein